jgi:hypothetical protein
LDDFEKNLGRLADIESRGDLTGSSLSIATLLQTFKIKCSVKDSHARRHVRAVSDAILPPLGSHFTGVIAEFARE